MNIHTRKLESEISECEFNQALSVIQKWKDQGGELDRVKENLIAPKDATALMRYPELADKYPTEFKLMGSIKLLFPICRMVLVR